LNGGGDILLGSGLDDADGETAQGGEIFWAVPSRFSRGASPRADGAAILVPVPVEDVMAGVFDGSRPRLYASRQAASAVWGVWLVSPKTVSVD